MIDIQRTRWPASLRRAADFPERGTWEHLMDEFVDAFRGFAREDPLTFGLGALAVGVLLGWATRPR
jgi:hypothetical protein